MILFYFFLFYILRCIYIKIYTTEGTYKGEIIYKTTRQKGQVVSFGAQAAQTA